MKFPNYAGGAPRVMFLTCLGASVTFSAFRVRIETLAKTRLLRALHGALPEFRIFKGIQNVRHQTEGLG